MIPQWMITMLMKWMLNKASLSQILLYHTVWNKIFFTKLIFIVYYLATSKTLRYWFYWINNFVKWNFNLKFVISDQKNPCIENFRFVEEQLLLLASFSHFPTTVHRHISHEKILFIVVVFDRLWANNLPISNRAFSCSNVYAKWEIKCIIGVYTATIKISKQLLFHLSRWSRVQIILVNPLLRLNRILSHYKTMLY